MHALRLHTRQTNSHKIPKLPEVNPSHITFDFCRDFVWPIPRIKTCFHAAFSPIIFPFVFKCIKMHPSPYVVTGSGYKRHFNYYSDVNYPPYDFDQYSQHNEKHCHSWLGWPSMPTQVTIEPHNHDVLLGRGGRNNQHTGNNILRQFGRVQGENYRVASKKGKSAISRLLVRQMRELNPPARYVIPSHGKF